MISRLPPSCYLQPPYSNCQYGFVALPRIYLHLDLASMRRLYGRSSHSVWQLLSTSPDVRCFGGVCPGTYAFWTAFYMLNIHDPLHAA